MSGEAPDLCVHRSSCAGGGAAAQCLHEPRRLCAASPASPFIRSRLRGVLLRVDPRSGRTVRRQGCHLWDFGVDERGFQAILFDNLEELLPDDELLLLMQSARGAEEPDLMAVDASGRLWLFEMKRGEGDQGNLLQVLRYGQIYGQWEYDQLSSLYAQRRGRETELADAHAEKFGERMGRERFNHRQVFVTLTNGLDDRSRAAINYWNDAGLDVRCWLYLVYETEGDEFDIELTPFRIDRDNPYQDLASVYYLLNTNWGNDPQDDEDMLEQGKAAAFFDPWKRRIETLNQGDTVFLYRSGEGIVAYGKASGILERHPYQGSPEHADEEYSMRLTGFRRLSEPVSAAQIKSVAGSGIAFRQTMVALPDSAGRALIEHLREVE